MCEWPGYEAGEVVGESAEGLAEREWELAEGCERPGGPGFGEGLSRVEGEAEIINMVRGRESFGVEIMHAFDAVIVQTVVLTTQPLGDGTGGAGETMAHFGEGFVGETTDVPVVELEVVESEGGSGEGDCGEETCV